MTERMRSTTRMWLGASFVLAAVFVYVLRGIPSGWDFAWHGGLFLLGLGMMMPKFFVTTLTQVAATVRTVFGKFTAQP